MDEMMSVLNKFPNATYVKLEWESAKLTLGGLIETIYQTDNGLPEAVSEYREYYAMVFRIKDVIKNESGQIYSGNMVMEVSTFSAPTRIWSQNDILIWQEKTGV
ncbi:MAG: hypothetical protein IJ794_17005 [Lachnospiraceae bacterium]|nr:hypothetical protein [Lachnospiraceae bacterium]